MGASSRLWTEIILQMKNTIDLIIFHKLSSCRVGVCGKQKYAAWSISTTDSLVSWCTLYFLKMITMKN